MPPPFLFDFLFRKNIILVSIISISYKKFSNFTLKTFIVGNECFFIFYFMVQAMEAVNSGNITTMTSLEIAKLTEKRHDHVLRDIEKMFEELSIDPPKFGDISKDVYGRDQKCYSLDKELTLTLVSGYNVKLRQAIIRKWSELEGASIKPRTYQEIMSEALQLAAQKVEELE